MEQSHNKMVQQLESRLYDVETVNKVQHCFHHYVVIVQSTLSKQRYDFFQFR